MHSPAELSDNDDNLLPHDRKDSGSEDQEINSDGGEVASDKGKGDTSAKNDDDNPDAENKKVDPTIKRVRAPQPKLNSERLKGPKGIQTIEKYFEGFKFDGKGHENTDLNRIMKRLEHWSHRLFPKFQFDDCIARIEKLGSKKDVQVYVKKIRLGMIEADDGLIRESMDVDEDDEKLEDSVPIDEFDALIAEQLEKQKQLTTPQRLSTTAMDTSLSINSSARGNPNVSGTCASAPSTSKSEMELSEEMKERVERNRQIAIQKRLARIQAMEEEANRKKVDQSEDNVLSSATVGPQQTESLVHNSSSSESKITSAPEDCDLTLELKTTQPREVTDINLQSTEETQNNEQDLKSEKSKLLEDRNVNLELENTRSQESVDNIQSIKRKFPIHDDKEPEKTKTQKDNNMDLEPKLKPEEVIDLDLEATLDEVICHKYRRNIQRT